IMVGGEGCACPENTLLKNLMRHLIIERDEVVILDMEAGLEHLGRGTVEAMDALIVMVEPGQRSLALAKRIEALARDIGIREVLFVGNKIQSEDDRKTVLAGLVNEQVLGLIDYDEGLRQADLLGKSVHEFASSKTLNSISEIKDNLEILAFPSLEGRG
ncbi:MAG: carbon monoxide dehydrogenase, partial [Actinomycetota bacterium]